ncbi:MAG: DUF134 domain-containing protein [Candidatus Aenigmarchaeota archaeon]|nr:DUF134 domain-containing protein [Candidatus Aenigmarchaeota archaeon]
MPRPRRFRIVRDMPAATFFKPVGMPMKDAEMTVLTVEEFEALRLKDLLGMGQAEAAEKMGVSQPTFHRMLTEARKKVADALANGKAISIEGGRFVLNGRRRRMGRP